ncbi:MAG: hypothetical protein KGL42_12190 [Betaproteobacteria bacterium]|nr:hypothetical protein [Betaproteobacteria bacterium]
MSFGDWIAIAALVIPSAASFGALLKWFGNHSERLRTAEVQINHLKERQTDDIQWIRSAVIRIEDKIDRKADR